VTAALAAMAELWKQLLHITCLDAGRSGLRKTNSNSNSIGSAADTPAHPRGAAGLGGSSGARNSNSHGAIAEASIPGQPAVGIIVDDQGPSGVPPPRGSGGPGRRPSFSSVLVLPDPAARGIGDPQPAAPTARSPRRARRSAPRLLLSALLLAACSPLALAGCVLLALARDARSALSPLTAASPGPRGGSGGGGSAPRGASAEEVEADLLWELDRPRHVLCRLCLHVLLQSAPLAGLMVRRE
jgi:hypothetical protein